MDRWIDGYVDIDIDIDIDRDRDRDIGVYSQIDVCRQRDVFKYIQIDRQIDRQTDRQLDVLSYVGFYFVHDTGIAEMLEGGNAGFLQRKLGFALVAHF